MSILINQSSNIRGFTVGECISLFLDKVGNLRYYYNKWQNNSSLCMISIHNSVCTHKSISQGGQSHGLPDGVHRLYEPVIGHHR